MRNRLRHMTTALGRLFSKRKRLAFIFLSMLVGLSPLLLGEVILRVCGLGLLSEADDPYIGFVNVRPLFKLNAEAGRFEIASERQTFFRPDSFPKEKKANEFRIFCLGGSTVQGRPYAIETSFTTWLELNLQTADPRYNWDVVNCGGVSYASYRLVPILQEVLEYEPDLIIICTGHNEFLEDRTYERVKQASRWVTQPHRWLSQLRTYNALRNLVIRRRSEQHRAALQQRAQLPEEVDALLDYSGGLDDYHRDPGWRAGTISHFEFNLNRMLVIARQRGVPTVLVNPPYNLKDTPPFKYVNRDGLSETEQKQFDQLWEEAKQEGITGKRRIALLQQAISIDGSHAGVRFHLGRCYLGQEIFDGAKTQFLAAKDEDICPLRILTPMRHIVAEAARWHAVPFVDAQELFEQLSPHGITGDDWFIDHVHPTMRGHQRLGSAIYETMVQNGWARSTEGWQAQRDKVFLNHLQSLDAMYYIRGQQRLEGLRKWTLGQANLTKPRTTETPSNSAPPGPRQSPQ